MKILTEKEMLSVKGGLGDVSCTCTIDTSYTGTCQDYGESDNCLCKNPNGHPTEFTQASDDCMPIIE
ncbi:MAG: hypothetical protein HWD84_09285 [Flavobacteriaceae bacterium]|nr:hypothetical protein [Flavobacteriaceae bacterium]